MNRFVLYIIFLPLLLNTLAQPNLIYNGSFEEYYSCPVSNDLNNGQLELAKGWWKPTLGTSDYFNACNTNVVGVPTNFWGYQQAFQGNAYVGIVPITWDKNTGDVNDKYEYIQSKLITSLKLCFEYKFTMYVSFAQYSTYAMKSIGAIFTADSIGHDFNIFIDAIPQVYNQKSYLKDSINWIKIEGNFVADGTEKFVTIGYFKSNVKDDTLLIQNSTIYPDLGYSYYYIDSVSLVEKGPVSEIICKFNGFSIPNVFTPNNDGINDKINISSYADLKTILTIYNRWGNEIAILSEDNPFWNGANCSDGVYFYILTYELNNKIKQQSGFIQLIR